MSTPIHPTFLEQNLLVTIITLRTRRDAEAGHWCALLGCRPSAMSSETRDVDARLRAMGAKEPRYAVPDEVLRPPSPTGVADGAPCERRRRREIAERWRGEIAAWYRVAVDYFGKTTALPQRCIYSPALVRLTMAFPFRRPDLARFRSRDRRRGRVLSRPLPRQARLRSRYL